MDTDCDLIGLGRVGRVIRFGEVAVKTANVWTVPENASEDTIICYQQMNKINTKSLEHEGSVYRQLGDVKGVLEPLQISDTEIPMPYLRHGSLDKYLLANKDAVGDAQRLQWFRDAAQLSAEYTSGVY